MAEKCTKTSSPVERWINPYPFAPLNHFTVPFSLTEKLLSLIVKNCSPVLGLRPGRPGPPSEEPVEPGCVYAVRGNYFQKGKDPLSSPSPWISTAGNSGVRQFGSFPPHPTNVNHLLCSHYRALFR